MTFLLLASSVLLQAAVKGKGPPSGVPGGGPSLDLQGAQFSVINSLRTGNVGLDTW